MRLKLVLRGPERLMGARLEKTLENGSLVVGRSPAAGWVLPDPDKVISKAHCRIDTDFSGFVLTDTSTNGVTVNDEALGFGLPRLLADGDTVKLGDAIVAVRIEADPVAVPAPTPQPSRVGIPGLASDGPFGSPEPKPEPKSWPTDSPGIPAASAPQTASNGPGAAILDDWWKADAPQNRSAEPISVDISDPRDGEEFPRTTIAKDPLPLDSGDVAFLVESLADIDVVTLARAVDAAGLVLADDERGRFHDRLRDLLAPDEGLRG